MKTIPKFVSLIILMFSSKFLIAQKFEIYKQTDLNRLLAAAKTDSASIIERLAALKFHQLLNKYRKENKLDTVAWNDIFWLTCRNHSVYMIVNDELTHTQQKGKEKFTGKEPGNRLLFVEDGNASFSWRGENALYFFNTSYIGKNAEEIAEDIAEKAFDTWKKSPGHNANMLGSGHKIHGAAFVTDGLIVYGTSLFGITVTPYYASQAIAYEKEVKTGTNENNQIHEERITVTSSSSIRKMLDKFIKNKLANLNPDKALTTSAMKHIEYLYANKEFTHEQTRGRRNFYAKTPQQRIAKAQGKLFWFLAKNSYYHEYIAVYETNVKDFQAEYAAEKILAELVEKNQLNLSGFSTYGFAIKVRTKDEKVKIWAVLII
ncbi:MAG: hypothetical protein GX437_13160 [Sphingobacteriales bacterium]|nr:hypothetical protein [Sphingobacteriales bacterium]